MSGLEPGDLCVIHGVSCWDIFGPECAGRHVVLVSSYPLVGHPECRDGIYWKCSGLPPGVSGVHTALLRKIPPAPMDDDEPTETDASAPRDWRYEWKQEVLR